MGATLATLRGYIRAEINDPAPSEKMSSSTLTHDGGDAAAFFQDATFNFVTQGIIVGDVVRNTTDGGSLATIQLISNGGGTNDKLTVGPIEGGTDNDYDDGDVVEIWDRHAQKGLDGTRFTNTEVEAALAQSQKIVAMRFGGIEKFDVHQDIKVMTKIDLVNPSGTFTLNETITGATNSHTAYVEYVGDDFLVISTMRTMVTVDNVTGTFLPGETVTGGTNSYTARVVSIAGGTDLLVEIPTGEFENNEELTGSTSAATCDVNEGTSYSSGLFASGEEVEGGTSAVTANIKATYSANNFYLGQGLPTDLKHLISARWWDGSDWQIMIRDHIEEYEYLPRSTGDPRNFSVYGDPELLWLWPNNSTKQYNELHLTYMAWDNALSSDTDTTKLDIKMERLTVLEAAKILAGSINEEKLWGRILNDIKAINIDIEGSDDSQSMNVRQIIDWDSGYGDEGAFF